VFVSACSHRWIVHVSSYYKSMHPCNTCPCTETHMCQPMHSCSACDMHLIVHWGGRCHDCSQFQYIQSRPQTHIQSPSHIQMYLVCIQASLGETDLGSYSSSTYSTSSTLPHSGSSTIAQGAFEPKILDLDLDSDFTQSKPRYVVPDRFRRDRERARLRAHVLLRSSTVLNSEFDCT